jgi:ubiquinone/menaquinone biosynthesis C-methylase UbiE
MDSVRNKLVKPVVEALKVEPDHVVVDLNSGTHRFALSIAERLQQAAGNGIVFALDYDDQMVDRLEREAARVEENLPLNPIALSAYEPDVVPFTTDSTDRLLAVNHLDSGERQQQTLNEIFRVLKPGGLALLVRWWPEGTSAPHRVDELARDFERLSQGVGDSGFVDAATVFLTWDLIALRAVKPRHVPEPSPEQRRSA